MSEVCGSLVVAKGTVNGDEGAGTIVWVAYNGDDVCSKKYLFSGQDLFTGEAGTFHDVRVGEHDWFVAVL